MQSWVDVHFAFLPPPFPPSNLTPEGNPPHTSLYILGGSVRHLAEHIITLCPIAINGKTFQFISLFGAIHPISTGHHRHSTSHPRCVCLYRPRSMRVVCRWHLSFQRDCIRYRSASLRSNSFSGSVFQDGWSRCGNFDVTCPTWTISRTTQKCNNSPLNTISGTKSSTHHNIYIVH